jgi:hypothetical protein
LKVDLSTVLSPKLKEKNSNVDKGVLKEHLSAFLSPQWKGNLTLISLPCTRLLVAMLI